MRSELRDAHPKRSRTEQGGQDAVWGVKGIMAETIVPDEPKQRRTRRRMRALRAMERLGLLEENLISTLAERPELRWLADERGARWAVLAELGRIGERSAFDEAVEWALEAHPNPMRLGTTFSVPGPAPKYAGLWVVDMSHRRRVPGGDDVRRVWDTSGT